MLYRLTVFLGAFLLFSLEPLVGKRIVPWFGGSAAVWTTCLVFFQTALLAGYAYARWLTHSVRPRSQPITHLLVLGASLAFLPIGPGVRWMPSGPGLPVWLIVAMLSATIGLPFIALSATSPLVQYWLAQCEGRPPYSLFAVSNFASLAALVAYPLVIEPYLDMQRQRWSWSALYVGFAGVCAAVAWISRKFASQEHPTESSDPVKPVAAARKALWFALAACGSMLLLSVTNHLTGNVAAVPLLWVLPLATYLLTFVLCFSGRKFYNRMLWLRLLAVALGVLGYAIYDINAIEAIQVSIPILLAGLFVCCMLCHGELNRTAPHSTDVTSFYLWIAAGGAVGAIFVGTAAPHLFRGIYELPISLMATALLALVVTWPQRSIGMRLLWIGAICAMTAVLVANVKAFHQDALALERSFYGSLRVVQSRHAGEDQTRTLFHGTIEHGAQFLAASRRHQPTTYYGPESGIGIVLRECFAAPKRVGVVGLGVGTVAAYGEPGDWFQFYEINQQIVDIAQSLFWFLRESRAGIATTLGDARLSLEHDSQQFEVLALDAFSGDAIPVHLLTREAMVVYRRHLAPEGVIAFHVSNDYLDLARVVKALADDAGYHSVLVRNHRDDDRLVLASDWVLVTNNGSVLQNASVKIHTQQELSTTGLRVWTDDYNNLLEILKTPELK